jgi:hypothetical protein
MSTVLPAVDERREASNRLIVRQRRRTEVTVNVVLLAMEIRATEMTHQMENVNQGVDVRLSHRDVTRVSEVRRAAVIRTTAAVLRMASAVRGARQLLTRHLLRQFRGRNAL